jgi:hypothetical protein
MCGVLSRRLKGAGKRWDSDNAEAIMALEALKRSDLWDQYWANVLKHATYAALAGVPG